MKFKNLIPTPENSAIIISQMAINFVGSQNKGKKLSLDNYCILETPLAI